MGGARQNLNGYWHAFISEANARNLSPLHFAVLQGCEDIVKYLIDHDVDIDSVSLHHETPLFMAAQENKIKIVKILLSQRINLDICDNNGMTALYIAALKGNLEIVNLLLQYGANQKLVDNNGYSALVAAVLSRQIEVVEAVLNTGVETRQLTIALVVAIQLHETEIVNLLRAREARLDNLCNQYATPLYVAIVAGRLRDAMLLVENFLPYEDITRGDRLHNTSLDIALEKSDFNLLSALIKKGIFQDSFINFIEKLISEKKPSSQYLNTQQSVDTILNLTFEIATATLQNQKNHTIKLKKLIKLLEPQISSAKQSLAKVGHFGKHVEKPHATPLVNNDSSIKSNEIKS